jgi:hypothetical protein
MLNYLIKIDSRSSQGERRWWNQGYWGIEGYDIKKEEKDV